MPTYWRSYLYVAYRSMDGVSLTAEERQEIQRVWFRIPASPENQQAAWSDLRSATKVPSPSLDKAARRGVSLDTRNFVQYHPCTPHAYQRAADRLREHLDRFGADSDEVREWVQAQDIAFHHCSMPGDGVFPAEAPPSIHPVIRDDRRYQMAAARFIATHFEEAEALFRNIEPDPESWAGLWAPYMVGRSILWQARTQVSDDEEYLRLLRRAQVALEAVLRDDDFAATHNAARFLLIRILSVTDPEAAVRLLGLRLMSPLRADSRVQDLDQYTSLLDHHTRRKKSYWTEKRPYADLRDLGSRDGLTDWILAFQSQDAAAYQHSLARWRKTGSTAWLLACLAKADGPTSEATELLAAAAEQPPGPGWASVEYYRARLLGAVGAGDQARAVVDRLAPEISQRSSSWNRALALRSQLGRTPEETLRYGVRKPYSYGRITSFGPRVYPFDGDTRKPEHLRRLLLQGDLLMPRTADILNSAVPLDRFAELAVEADWAPALLQQDLLIAAWVRAALLNDQPRAVALADHVAAIAPETNADMAHFRAAAPKNRQFVAIGIILKFPGMSARVYPGLGRHAPLDEIHAHGFNWWWWTKRGAVDPTPPTTGPVDWLSPAERAQAKREWKSIVALGNGAAFLYQAVLDRCTGPSPPPGCAEALYRTALTEDWIRYSHGVQYLPYDIERAVREKASETLRKRFGRTAWARHFKSDQAIRKTPWQDDSGGYLQSAPYPH